MRKQDQLSQLIKALSKNEKTYFKQFTNIRSEDKSYVALFDELQKSDVYDVDALSKALKKDKKNLAHEKVHLQSTLLKALRNYHSEQHVESRIANGILAALLLSNKGQNELALAITRAAQAEAEQYEFWPQVWDLLMIENTLTGAINMPWPEILKLQQANINRMQKVAAHITAITQFEALNLQLTKIGQKRVVVRKATEASALRKLLKHPLLQQKPTTIKEQAYQAELLYNIYVKLADFTNALAYAQRAFELADKYPQQYGAALEGYFVVLNNYLVMLGFCNKYKEAYAVLEKLKQSNFAHLPYDSEAAKKIMRAYAMHTELWLVKKSGNYKKGLPLIKELKTNYSHYRLPSVAEFTGMLYNCLQICFFNRQYDECIYWAEKMFADTEPSSRIEAHCMANLIFTLCHAELKNYSLLPYLINNTEKFLKKNKGYHAPEKATLDFLKLLPKLKTEEQKKVAYSMLTDTYKDIQQKPGEQGGMRFFDYSLWAGKHL